jgi:protein involved in polysaccharide export with SLBB domain
MFNIFCVVLMMASAPMFAAHPQGVDPAPVTSGSIWLAGEVLHPGMFQMSRERSLTISQAIALAGGFTKAARKENIQIIRKDANGNLETAVVDGRAILTGAAPDVTLNPNDVIFVPARIGTKYSPLGQWPILIAQ